MALPLLKTDKHIHINGFQMNRLGCEDYDMYREFYARATPADLSFYSSFPILMRGGQAWQVIDGFLFLFALNEIEGRCFVDALNLPRNMHGEFLDVASTKHIIDRINGSSEGFIMSVHPDLAERYGPADVRPKLNTIGNEYVYDNRLLAQTEGGVFRNLRKNANRFGNRTNFEIVPYERRLRQHADKVYNNWCASLGLKYEFIWDRNLYRNLLDAYGEIDHALFMVLDKDRNEYIGFFDAVTINATLAVGVFRKLSDQYKGIAEYCQIYLAKQLAARGITYINDGDDCYEDGLQMLKEKFHPVATFTPVQFEF